MVGAFRETLFTRHLLKMARQILFQTIAIENRVLQLGRNLLNYKYKKDSWGFVARGGGVGVKQ